MLTCELVTRKYLSEKKLPAIKSKLIIKKRSTKLVT